MRSIAKTECCWLAFLTNSFELLVARFLEFEELLNVGYSVACEWHVFSYFRFKIAVGVKTMQSVVQVVRLLSYSYEYRTIS